MDLITYIHKGGIIMYILVGLNIIGFSLIIFKMIQYIIINIRFKYLLGDIYSKLSIYNNEQKYMMSQDIINEKISIYENGLNTIKIIATISPLLGLLGTVTGVLLAFDEISKQGLGNPSIFSNGISLALITTVAGLIVAIPHYISYNYFVGILDKFEIRLTKEINQTIVKESL